MCQQTPSAVLAYKKDSVWIGEKYTVFPMLYVLCKVCGLIYQAIQMQDLEAYYQSGDYRKTVTGGDKEVTEALLLEQTRRAEHLRETLSPYAIGRALDIGCSTGALLEMLRDDHFMDITGVDPNTHLAKIEVHPSLATVEGKFDLITMIHVFEHLPNPAKYLSDLRNMANKGCKLVIEVPDANRHHASLWSSHITAYTKRTLRVMLSAIGWKVLSMQNHDGTHGNRKNILAVCELSDPETIKVRTFWPVLWLRFWYYRMIVFWLWSL
jgi:SAM-dependent methyltransferase